MAGLEWGADQLGWKVIWWEDFGGFWWGSGMN